MKETIEAEIVEENKQVVLSEIKYPVNNTDLDALLNEYAEIPEINPNDDEDLVGEQYQFVLVGHKKFVKARNQIEKTRKELKSPALDYGKTVDNIAKEFQAKIKTTEDKLQFQRKLVEDNEARKQAEAEALEDARIDKIKGLMLDIKNLALVHFNSDSESLAKALEALTVPSEEIYQEFLSEARETQQIAIMQLQEMRKSKVLAEKAEELEAEREIEAQKLKDEQDAKLAKEKDDLAKEKYRFDREKQEFEKQQREQQEIIDRQKAEIEADELAKRQEIERVEREKQEAFERQQREERIEEERQQHEQQNKELYDGAKAQLVSELKELKTITKIANAIIDGSITNLTWRF